MESKTVTKKQRIENIGIYIYIAYIYIYINLCITNIDRFIITKQLVLKFIYSKLNLIVKITQTFSMLFS